ncbi:bifunctional RmlC-like cupin domain superfamily/Mannose-6-phosphate isomerase/Mannose-6-phosphate isomerase [Babesia duncani]|uniref:mannose-6-phosphate isomerase n=1 Tax=Babesia duncani TaxID=323732 RepID=A0AAD9PK15_9APIC|nr:bifunctional RmlC-like cupin domain superfamily/Mannose-6-phosphate isomerase/Mannose-6-phosphate isomerase [Babesia duncani]
MGFITKIIPAVQCYDWGKDSKESLVYDLYTKATCAEGASEAISDSSKKYAELWLGTHYNGPCRIAQVNPDCANSHILSKPTEPKDPTPSDCMQPEKFPLLSEVVSAMNSKLYGTTTGELSILFKVLSVAKPLSLQMHPDSITAARLAQQGHPQIVDANAKPEMCIALTPFKLMAGLRQTSEIRAFASRYSTFAAMIEGIDIDDVFHLLHCLLIDTTNQQRLALVKQVEKMCSDSIEMEFIHILYHHYGLDACITFPLVLQCHLLAPGQALYIAPNTLHAYIHGDCLEVMENSDNVLRCGLTLKPCSIETCLEILKETTNYKSSNRVDVIARGCSRTYKPLDLEAKFQIITVHADVGQSCTFDSSETKPTLGIILECNSTCIIKATSRLDASIVTFPVSIGTCLFMYPGTRLDVETKGEPFKMHLASAI